MCSGLDGAKLLQYDESDHFGPESLTTIVFNTRDVRVLRARMSVERTPAGFATGDWRGWRAGGGCGRSRAGECGLRCNQKMAKMESDLNCIADFGGKRKESALALRHCTASNDDHLPEAVYMWRLQGDSRTKEKMGTRARHGMNVPCVRRRSDQTSPGPRKPNITQTTYRTDTEMSKAASHQPGNRSAQVL